MSASLVVDLRHSTQYDLCVAPANGVDSSPASGAFIGQFVDLRNADTYCNFVVTGGAGSGPFRVQVQDSDAITSGSFTDPTSGMRAEDIPPPMLSGGIIWINSGLHVSGWFNVLGSRVNNAPLFCSGGVAFGAWQRKGRYARVNILSGGVYGAPVAVGIVSQLRTVGSGAGFSYLPQSGNTINV